MLSTNVLILPFGHLYGQKQLGPDTAGLPEEVKLLSESEQYTPKYISVGWAAKHCGVSNTTVLRWINTGQLPAFRLPGGHYRIERDDFSGFLTRYRMPARITRYEIKK